MPDTDIATGLRLYPANNGPNNTALGRDQEVYSRRMVHGKNHVQTGGDLTTSPSSRSVTLQALRVFIDGRQVIDTSDGSFTFDLPANDTTYIAIDRTGRLFMRDTDVFTDDVEMVLWDATTDASGVVSKTKRFSQNQFSEVGVDSDEKVYLNKDRTAYLEYRTADGQVHLPVPFQAERVLGLPTPTLDGEAAPKSYVDAHGATGAAGGDLAGTYPNPTIGTSKVTSAKIASAAVTEAKLGDGAVTTPKLANDAVTNTKLANMGGGTVKGRTQGGGTGDPQDLTAAQLMDIIGTVDGAGSNLDADLLDGQHAAEFSRHVATLTAGSSSDANHWTKVATLPVTGNHNNAAVLFAISVGEEGSGAGGTVVVSAELRQGNGTVDGAWVNILAKGQCTVFGDDSFKVISNGFDGAHELWVQKKAQFGAFRVFLISEAYDIAGVVTTWHSGQGWQAGEPTGSTVNVKSAGLKYGTGKIWHETNDGSGSGLDADTLDGVQGSQYARKDQSQTITGDLTLSGTGSRKLTIEADSDNNGEDDVATLELRQDGGLVGVDIGTDSDNRAYVRPFDNGAGGDSEFYWKSEDGSTRQKIWHDGNTNDAVTSAKLANDAVTSAKLANDAVTNAKLANDAVTNAKLADMAARTVKGRATSTTGDPGDIAIGTDQVLGRVGSGDIAGVAIAQGATANALARRTSSGQIKAAAAVADDEVVVKSQLDGLGSAYDTARSGAKIFDFTFSDGTDGKPSIGASSSGYSQATPIIKPGLANNPHHMPSGTTVGITLAVKAQDGAGLSTSIFLGGDVEIKYYGSTNVKGRNVEVTSVRDSDGTTETNTIADWDSFIVITWEIVFTLKGNSATGADRIFDLEIFRDGVSVLNKTNRRTPWGTALFQSSIDGGTGNAYTYPMTPALGRITFP